MSKRIPSIYQRHRAIQRRGLAAQQGSSSGISLASSVLSGVMVTPQTALSMIAVFAAINVISRDTSSLPIGTYRRLPGGGKRPESDDVRTRLLHVTPDDGETNAAKWRQALMGHVLGWGNGYAEIVRDGDGLPSSLHLLHPGNTKPKRTEAGKLYYELDGGKKKPLIPSNVIHIAGFGFDGLSGYCPILMGRQAIGLGIGAEEWGASLFGNGAVPKGYLKTAKRLSEVAARNLRESFERVHGGSKNANRIAVLEDGLDWVETQISPEAAQFLATRAFQVIEIARLYSVPPHKIGDYSQSHMANVEEANLDYLVTTLAGWLIAIEAELNLKLFTEEDRNQGLFLAHDMGALLRGNMAARAAFYQVLRNLGAITSDEIRSAEGMNPAGPENGGDLLLVQSQYTRLSEAGKIPPKAIDGPAPAKRSSRRKSLPAPPATV
jgi:HK97 family phage portal protein